LSENQAVAEYNRVIDKISKLWWQNFKDLPL
jgi:hypothetical protein